MFGCRGFCKRCRQAVDSSEMIERLRDCKDVDRDSRNGFHGMLPVSDRISCRSCRPWQVRIPSESLRTSGMPAAFSGRQKKKQTKKKKKKSRPPPPFKDRRGEAERFCTERRRRCSGTFRGGGRPKRDAGHARHRRRTVRRFSRTSRSPKRPRPRP